MNAITKEYAITNEQKLRAMIQRTIVAVRKSEKLLKRTELVLKSSQANNRSWTLPRNV